MTIHIDDLSFDAILGVLDTERRIKQNIVISLKLLYEYDDRSGYIDYSEIVSLIKDHIQTVRYRLLEEAVTGLKNLLFEHYPAAKELHIKISKPDILPECTVSVSERW